MKDLYFSSELRRLLTDEEVSARQIGLGTAIKTITTALGIKPCGGCRRRADSLDRMVPNVNPLARKQS